MGPLFLLLAVSAVAESSPPSTDIVIPDPRQSALSSGRSVGDLLNEYNSAFYDKRYGDGLAILDQLHPDDGNIEGKALLSAMRASALLGLKRNEEATQLIAGIRELRSASPAPYLILFEGALVVKRFDVAGDALDWLVAQAPEAARQIDTEDVFFFLRNEPKGEEARNEDRRVALARIGFGGELEGAYLASRAVDILVKRGDLRAATDLLPRVTDPHQIQDMLIQKRYAAMWPTLEKFGGPHLSAVAAASVVSAERAYRAAPDDHEKLSLYANALREAGRLDDAIALKSKLPDTPEAMARADEQMGWAVNNIAYALHQAGRTEEADKLLEMLNHASIERGGWRVSMIINRLEMLASSGNFEKAATLVAETEASAKADGSDYARQLVRRLQYCISSRLGRKAEAAAIRPVMLEHADDSLEATIGGLLCAGDTDAAASLTLKTLADSKMDAAKLQEFEKDFVSDLQPVALLSDDPSVWDNAWRDLRKRPDIAKEFDRLGRDMPAELLPEKAQAAAK